LFAPAIMAFESGDHERIQQVLAAAGEDLKSASAVSSALGWLPLDWALPQIEPLLVDTAPVRRYIGIAACALHRHDPGTHLERALSDHFPPLVARALRAYGELGRGRELSGPRLRTFLAAADDQTRFSAAWSAALGGASEAVASLQGFVVAGSPYAEKALNVSLRCLRHEVARAWQQELAQSPATLRLATMGAGVLGDPHLIPWLIDRMAMPELARVAGEAFAMLTGVVIEHEELHGAQPKGFHAGPTDDPHDIDLPWPDAGLIAGWWNRNNGRFQDGTRYLLGQPIAADQLPHVLAMGRQRERAAAALELAIRQPGEPVCAVHAPGGRQLRRAETA
jgi:uncharacterized protein (TIGR02270 family)